MKATIVAINSTPNLRLLDVTADREVLVTLQTLSDYSPRRESAGIPALKALVAAVDRAEEAELTTRRAHEVAREELVAARAALHAGKLEAKQEVITQYGADSPAVHAIGRKRKSERRRPGRRARPTAE